MNIPSVVKAIHAPDGRAVAADLRQPDPPDVGRAVAALVAEADARTPLPPFPGKWVPRESLLPAGLNAAKDIKDICWFCPDEGEWRTGITSQRNARHFVRVG